MSRWSHKYQAEREQQILEDINYQHALIATGGSGKMDKIMIWVCLCVITKYIEEFHVSTAAHQGSSVQGILQARILESVAVPSSKGSS